MVLAAMAACAVLGVVIERFAYRPLRDAPRIAPLISALGVSFFLSYSVQLLFGANHRTYDTFNMAGGKLFEPAVTIGSFSISWLRVIGIVAAVVLMLVLWFLVDRTRIGKAMRATSIDRDAAAMMGIDIDRVIMFAFVLSGALAGAAGVLFALRTDLFPQMGFTPGLFAFTAAVIGGIGSIPGAMLGGVPARHRRGRHRHVRHRVDRHPGGPLEPRHLLAADRVHARAAAGHPRHDPTSRRCERVTEGPRIGKDEWVARSGENIERHRLLRAGGPRPRLGAPPPASASFVAAIPLVTDDGYINVVVFDTLIFCLLAIGLNVVVGWGGLLDLGYIAFFGVGAYTYAILSSEQVRPPPHVTARDGDLRRPGSAPRAPRRPAVVAPLRRLPRDRDAVRLPDLHQHRHERQRPVRASI